MKFIFANPGTFLGNGRANSHQSGERQATPDPTGGLDPDSRVPVGTRDPMGVYIYIYIYIIYIYIYIKWFHLAGSVENENKTIPIRTALNK